MVTMAFQTWVGYGPLYLAADLGYFEQEGLEVFFVDETMDSSRQDAFNSGMLDCEAGTLDLLAQKRAFGTPVVAVMALDYSNGGDGIVVSAEIKKIDDLRGKKIALAKNDVGDTFLSYLLRENNIPTEAVTIIPCKTDNAWEAFTKNQADAVVTWEPFLSKSLQRSGSHVLISSREASGIIADTLNVREDLVRNNPQLVKKIIRAWFKALEYYRLHPIEASRIISRYYDMKPEEYRSAVEKVLWLDYLAQVKTFGDDRMLKVFDEISMIKHENGKIPKVPKAQDAINNQLLITSYEASK
jgi:NitT/TauT family transport system substrate-binding protein